MKILKIVTTLKTQMLTTHFFLQNLFTQIVTTKILKLRQTLKNLNWDTTPNLQLLQNPKTQIVTIHNSLNCDQT